MSSGGSDLLHHCLQVAVALGLVWDISAEVLLAVAVPKDAVQVNGVCPGQKPSNELWLCQWQESLANPAWL